MARMRVPVLSNVFPGVESLPGGRFAKGYAGGV